MVDKNTKFGIFFAILANITGGIQPVIANMRPSLIDSYLFAGMTALIQMLLFIPIYFFENLYRKRKVQTKNNLSDLNVSNKFKLYFGNSKWYLFVIIGLMFSFVMFLYYSGLRYAGSINGTLALKSTAFFGLLFGALLLKERVSKLQIIFSIFLFFGLVIAVTQGNFNLLELNLGVLMILLCAAIWMFGHSSSRPYLRNGITFSSELVLWRNIFTSIILIISYVLIFGIEKFIFLVSIPEHIYSYFVGGLIYGLNVFFWYQIIKYLKISIGTILITPQVIVTAFFGSIFLNEPFTIYHVIGLIIIISSIIVINYDSKK